MCKCLHSLLWLNDDFSKSKWELIYRHVGPSKTQWEFTCFRLWRKFSLKCREGLSEPSQSYGSRAWHTDSPKAQHHCSRSLDILKWATDRNQTLMLIILLSQARDPYHKHIRIFQKQKIFRHRALQNRSYYTINPEGSKTVQQRSNCKHAITSFTHRHAGLLQWEGNEDSLTSDLEGNVLKEKK